MVAVKDAPFNRYMKLDVVRTAVLNSRSGKIALYMGNDDNIVVDLLARYRFKDKNDVVCEKRFENGLLGHWSVWTKTVVDIFEKIKAYEESDAIPLELLTLNAAVTDCNAAFFDVANAYADCIAGVH